MKWLLRVIVAVACEMQPSIFPNPLQRRLFGPVCRQEGRGVRSLFLNGINFFDDIWKWVLAGCVGLTDDEDTR